MSYRIAYDQKNNSRYPMKKKQAGTGKQVVLVVTILLAITGFMGMWRSGVLKSCLLPGNSAVTEAAITAMIDDIGAGESITDALTAFCREIIDHANIPG